MRLAKEGERAAIAIYMYGLQAWKELDLCRDWPIDLKRVRQLIEGLVASGAVIEVTAKPRGTFCVHHEVLKEAEQRILSILSQLHHQWPLRPSIPRDRVALKCQSWHDAHVTDAFFDRLVEGGAVRSDHGKVALASFSPQLTPGSRAAPWTTVDGLA